jgi:hypothetical protein
MSDFESCPKCGAPLTGKREAACGSRWSGSGNIMQSRACVYVLRLTTEARAITDAADGIIANANLIADNIKHAAQVEADAMIPEMREKIKDEFKVAFSQAFDSLA